MLASCPWLNLPLLPTTVLLLLMTQASGASMLTSRWVLSDPPFSDIIAEQVTTRSKSSCAGACLQMPGCSGFAFRKTGGSCLVESPSVGTWRSVAGHRLYRVVTTTVTTQSPVTTAETPLPTTAVPAACGVDLGYVYDAFYNTCIYHDFKRRTWYQARDFCVSLGAGHLYNIQDQKKWDALKTYFYEKGIDPWTQWVGATDEVTEGVWKWTDGTDASVMLSDKWDPPNPDNWGPSGEDYVLIYGSNWDFVDKASTDIAEGLICEYVSLELHCFVNLSSSCSHIPLITQKSVT